jgi:hypothetical protein
MRTLFTNQALTVQAGEAVSGMAKRAETLHIASGRVWITVEGIKHDYFLHAGDSFTAIPGRLIVLEADHEAKIEQRRPAAWYGMGSLARLVTDIAQRLQRSATVQTSMQRRGVCSGQC